VRPHSLSHFPATHAVRGAYALEAPGGWSSRHCDRHCQSPVLQPPRHWKWAAHVGSPPHAVDSAQQLVAAHAAHAVVP
jgi:hypothetical protein